MVSSAPHLLSAFTLFLPAGCITFDYLLSTLLQPTRVKGVILYKKDAQMKRIEAVIKPYKLDDVKEALSEIGSRGLTVFAVSDYDRNIGLSKLYPGTKHYKDFVSKIYIEMIASDRDADKIAATILAAAKSDEYDEGKITITSVESVIRIRTGELDQSAL